MVYETLVNELLLSVEVMSDFVFWSVSPEFQSMYNLKCNHEGVPA